MRLLSRNVMLLAGASLLADVSGEMLMAVLPFLLVAQGADALAVGLFGGASDALGHLVKALGGRLGDRAAGRKPLIVAGYATAALSRFGIALAPAWPVTLAFRGLDRVGKGLRTAPRDALLAESVAPAARGRAFGFHRTADTTGAVLGSAAALVGVLMLGASTRTLVLMAGAVGLLTLVPLLFVRDPRAGGARATDGHASKRVFEHPSPRYRAFLLVAAVFALGNVSYLFYMLRAGAALGGEAAALRLYVLFNVVYAALSYPVGILGDRISRPRVLAAGFALFSVSAALLVLAPTPLTSVLAFAALGVSFAATDATERAYAADLAGTEGRSTRLGVFHMTIGLATVVGGLVAGALWQQLGASWTFAWGAALPLVAFALLVGGGFLSGGR